MHILGQWHCFRHVDMDDASNQFERVDVCFTGTVIACTACWDDQCCKIKARTLLNAATNHVVKACLLTACSPGSSDGLDVLPLCPAQDLNWTMQRFVLLLAPVVQQQPHLMLQLYVIYCLLRANCVGCRRFPVFFCYQ